MLYKLHQLIYHQFSGYAGHQPFSWPQFGQSHQVASKNALCDFTQKYQHRKSTEWAPIAGVGMYKPNPTFNCQSNIYHTNTGMVPNYQGHVPGQVFRYENKSFFAILSFNILILTQFWTNLWQK
jgi:hypothetical protein